jgi:hypothetical protein
VTTGLSPAAYVAGSVSLVAAAAVLGWGAWRLRGALLPEWAGPPARLAELVMALAAVIGLGQILGTFAALRRFPMLIVGLAVGLAMGLVGVRITSSRERKHTEPAPRSRREEILAVALAGAVIAAQWATHVAYAYGRGMTHPDTVWYHAPYAARFVESGSTTGLPDRSDVLQSYYPLNSSLVHALVELPFRSDVLAPMVNVEWAALALLAAWCIGRRRGVAPLCVLGVVVVLGLPMIAGTQPGQASNDVACSGLLLVAVALLLEGKLSPIPTALAGVAAGLAIGTKLTVLAPVAVLTVGVVALAVRARRIAPAVAWSGGLALFGSYWYVRNLVIAHNPLPWFEIHLGPLSLPRSVVDKGDTIAGHLRDDLSWWRYLIFPGLTQALGRAWPLVLILALLSVVLLVLSRSSFERLIGLALVAGVVAYVLTPESAGLNFSFNVRYLTPVLLLSFVLLPIRLETVSIIWRRVVMLVMLGLIALNTTARHVERVPAWPSSGLVIGALAGIALVGGVGLLLWAPRPRLSLRAATMVAAALVGVAVIAGWPLQRHYLERRYVRAGLPSDGVDNYFRKIRNANVIVFGTVETYAMDGLDLSNRVTVGQGPTTKPRGNPCHQWPRIVEGRYQYVVYQTRGSFIPAVTPPREWFVKDPAATEVFRDGENVIYRVHNALHPENC